MSALKEGVIKLSEQIEIPVSELIFRYTRSSGPGGQHVNKTSTQVELVFPLAQSPSIPEPDKLWLLERLKPKLDSEGNIRITSQASRSQSQNKSEAVERLQETLRLALRRPKKRKPTKPKRSAIEKRIEKKKQIGAKKAERRQRF
jgi:ribosome-associated protein